MPIDVLLVEDDPGDVLMTREAFEEHKVGNRLNVVSDGVDALAYLRKEGEYADATTPDLILLDLNLPSYGGLEVLRELRNDPDEDLRVMPVLVLTTSGAPADVRDAYLRAANAYLTKPVDPDRLREVLESIASFWMGSARLPGQAMP